MPVCCSGSWSVGTDGSKRNRRHALCVQIKAEDCLKLEEERVSNYMHQSSRTSLLKEVETEVLQQHQTTLLEKEQSGCAALLQDDKVALACLS